MSVAIKYFRVPLKLKNRRRRSLKSANREKIPETIYNSMKCQTGIKEESIMLRKIFLNIRLIIQN